MDCRFCSFVWRKSAFSQAVQAFLALTVRYLPPELPLFCRLAYLAQAICMRSAKMLSGGTASQPSGSGPSFCRGSPLPMAWP